MKTVRMTIDPAAPATWASGRMDPARVDATTEKSIALQHAADEAEAIAEKVSALKTESYFRERMARGQDAAFDIWLDASPAVPADAGDELP